MAVVSEKKTCCQKGKPLLCFFSALVAQTTGQGWLLLFILRAKLRCHEFGTLAMCRMRVGGKDGGDGESGAVFFL